MNEYSKIVDTLSIEEEEWEKITCKIEIESYLPNKNHIQFSFEGKQKVTSSRLKVHTLSNDNDTKPVFAINTGGPIWALDFVPKTDVDSNQYLALGGYKLTNEQHVLDEITNYRNAIQIWNYSGKKRRKPKLDMCILYEFGIIADMKWCPSQFYKVDNTLGLLAVLVGDGSIHILVVPHPDRIRTEMSLEQDDTVHLVVKKPRLLLKLPRTYHLCLSWSQGLLACGTLLGHIVVWDIFRSLHFQTPMIHIQIPEADRSSVRNISWVSQLGQRFILSIDIAGSVYTHDLNDPYFGHQVMRLRSACAPLVVFNNNPPSFFFGDNDGDSRLNTSIIIKQSMSVALSDFGHIWSLSFCQSCETIASSSSTGTVMTKSCANCVGQFRKKKERENGDLLYQLSYDNGTFHYSKGAKNHSPVDQQDFHRLFIDPIVALHKVTWNPNEAACKWIASGGKAGLCRLEFLGKI